MDQDLKKTREKVENLLVNFNFNELKLEPNLANNFIEIKREINTVDSDKELNSIQKWLEVQCFEFDKKNLRFIKFSLIDRKDKYTEFYWILRNLFEANFPVHIHTVSFEWQILDIAIIQLEYDLKCALREETDLFWWVKFTEYFSINNDSWGNRINEFVKLFNLLNKEKDWYFLEVREKHFVDGYYDSTDEVEEFFIAKNTKENERISYEDAWAKLEAELVDQVSDKMRILRILLKQKYNNESLMCLLEIDKVLNKEFTKWYDVL